MVLTNVKIQKTLQAIAKEHFDIESELQLIAIYPKESLCEFLLIEVNDEAIPTGHIEPFYFAPNVACLWPLYIADVTRKEWTQIEQGTISLPPGWPRKPALIFRRGEALGQ